MPDARVELNRSVREGRMESIHFIKSLEGMGSSSHDLGAELRMHSFTVNCGTLLNEEKVAAVVPSIDMFGRLMQHFAAVIIVCLLCKCWST